MKALVSATQPSRCTAGVSTPARKRFRRGEVKPFGGSRWPVSTRKRVRSATALLLLALLTLGAAAPVQQAKDVKIALSTQLDRTAIWVGDTFHYSVKAVHDPAIEIVVDSLKKDSVNLAPFVVREVTVRQGPFGANKILTEIKFLLTSYESGQAELKIPSFPLYYFTRAPGARARAERAAESVAVPVAKIALRSTLTQDNPRPRDSREIWQVTRPRWMVPLALGLAGIVLVAIQLVRRLWRRSSREQPVRKRLSPRARQRLVRDFMQRAQAIGRDSPADQQRYYAEVSGFLRSYLRESLEIDAASLTAQEIASTLRDHGQNGLSAPVKNILERCEQVLYSSQGVQLGQGWRDEMGEELAKFADLARH